MAPLSQFAVEATIPPIYARPTAPRSRLYWPEPTGYDGNGNPCGAVGKPYYVFYRRYITQAGHAWWLNLWVDNTDYYALPLETISIYDQRSNQMMEFSSGTMLFPKWEGENSNLWYENYEFRIVELVPA